MFVNNFNHVGKALCLSAISTTLTKPCVCQQFQSRCLSLVFVNDFNQETVRESSLSIHSLSGEQTRAFIPVRDSNLSTPSLLEERTRAFLSVRESNFSIRSLPEEQTRKKQEIFFEKTISPSVFPSGRDPIVIWSIPPEARPSLLTLSKVPHFGPAPIPSTKVVF